MTHVTIYDRIRLAKLKLHELGKANMEQHATVARHQVQPAYSKGSTSWIYNALQWARSI